MSCFLFPRSLSLFLLLSFFKAPFCFKCPFLFQRLFSTYFLFFKNIFLPNSTCASCLILPFLFHSFCSFLFWKLPCPLCVSAASFLLPSFFCPFPSSFLPYIFSSHLPLSPVSLPSSLHLCVPDFSSRPYGDCWDTTCSALQNPGLAHTTSVCVCVHVLSVVSCSGPLFFKVVFKCAWVFFFEVKEQESRLLSSLVTWASNPASPNTWLRTTTTHTAGVRVERCVAHSHDRLLSDTLYCTVIRLSWQWEIRTVSRDN